MTKYKVWGKGLRQHRDILRYGTPGLFHLCVTEPASVCHCHPQLNKLVRLIDQSLYESGYLISNSEGRGGGRKRKGGCKCIDAGRVRGQKQGRGKKKE